METLGALLDRGTELLSGVVGTDARRDALRLWADLAHTQVADALLRRDVPVDTGASAAFLAAVERRARGEPLAYVTGWTGFRHLTLACDARALIPRPETEGLIDAVLARASTGVAADIGTGTGAIALALRGEGRFDEVIGIDISPDALALARANGASTGLDVTWLEGDALAPIAGRPIDVLISNPPYLTEREYDNLDGSVRDYEPRVALPSGGDGLTLSRHLLDAGRTVVVPGGSLRSRWIAGAQR